MEVSSSKSSSSLMASVLEALDYQAQGAPHPFPDFRCTKPTMCLCGCPITAGNVEKPGLTCVKTSCLFSLGSHLRPGSSKEQKFRYKCDASIPGSSLNPFRCHGAQQGHADKAQNFLAALHVPAAWQAQALGTPRSEQPCKEQRVLTKFIWCLSYPGEDQNSPETGLFPVFPGETAPHYYEFSLTLVPSQLPGFFLCQNCSELIKRNIWV